MDSFFLSKIQKYFQPKKGREKEKIQPGSGKKHSYKKKR